MKVTANRDHRGRFGLIEKGVEYDTATDANIVRALEERPGFFTKDEPAPEQKKKSRSGVRKGTKTVEATTDPGFAETR